jgi:hypothetical protein
MQEVYELSSLKKTHYLYLLPGDIREKNNREDNNREVKTAK